MTDCGYGSCYPVRYFTPHDRSPAGSWATDVTIVSSNPNTNYEGVGTLYCGHFLAGAQTARILFTLDTFEIPEIPANAEIRQVGLELYLMNSALSNNATVLQVFRLKRDWVDVEATWNEYEAGSAWSTPGAFGVDDCEQTPIASCNLAANEADGWKRFVITTGATTWDELNTWMASGLNLLIRAQTESNNQYQFWSSDGAAVTLRPRIAITFWRERFTPSISGVVYMFALDPGMGKSVVDNAYSYMRANGVPGTAYVVSNVVGGVNDAQWADLQAMHADGWAIGNHTDNHNILTALTSVQQEARIEGCVTALTAHGMPDNAYHVSYPGGYVNATVVQTMKRIGGLTGGIYLNLEMGCDINCPKCFYIPCNRMNPDMSLAQAIGLIDEALANDTIALLLFHEVEAVPGSATSWATADFEDLVDYVVATGITAYTIPEIYDLWFCEESNTCCRRYIPQECPVRPTKED